MLTDILYVLTQLFLIGLYSLAVIVIFGLLVLIVLVVVKLIITVTTGDINDIERDDP